VDTRAFLDLLGCGRSERLIAVAMSETETD